MDFEWDETKRLKNIKKHGLDFIDIIALFEQNYVAGAAKTVDGERRLLAIGKINNVFVTVIYTEREGVLRIISLRRASANEKRHYQEIFGG